MENTFEIRADRESHGYLILKFEGFGLSEIFFEKTLDQAKALKQELESRKEVAEF